MGARRRSRGGRSADRGRGRRARGPASAPPGARGRTRGGRPRPGAGAGGPVRLAERWLDRAPDVLDRDRRSALLGAVDERWALVTGEPAVLHADAHPANWFADEAGPWLMIDPEYLSIGPAVYDLAPLEVVERRLGAGPSRFPSCRAGYEDLAGAVDGAALAAAIGTRELLSVAWLAARATDPATAGHVRDRLADALAGRPGGWRT
ncbi:MAG: phosphotransferase family protein [Actinomycetota bacterium]